MNSTLKEIIELSTEKGQLNSEKLAQLIVEKCCEVLSEKALSFYDPNNKAHMKKEAWDRSLSWAIRDASEEIKQKFGVD